MKKYWIGFTAIVVISFMVLGFIGVKIYQQAPPIPQKIVTSNGEVIFDVGEISIGQNVWQAMGGMEIGSVWGHGSYVAPDWTADWLHREAMYILNKWSEDEYGSSYEKLNEEAQAKLKARLTDMVKENRYDEASGSIIIEPVRAEAIKANIAYYTKLFKEGKEEYALPPNTLTDENKIRMMSGFFFWSSWAASVNRPGKDLTYTSNWPHEELVDNKPTSETVVWTGVSIIVLLAGIAGMAWFYASRREDNEFEDVPKDDPLLYTSPTPSQKAVVKYFWVVAGLFLLQILLGVVTAHYGVEGNGFYGIPLAEILPYSVSRTWHTQLGIF